MASIKTAYMPEESRRLFSAHTTPPAGPGRIWQPPTSQGVWGPVTLGSNKPPVGTSALPISSVAVSVPSAVPVPVVPRPVSRESLSSLASASTSLASSPPASTSPKDDEVIPTAIVVKNIPFAIKKEQLLDFMTQQNIPLPYAFNYHFDNGLFRGLAFANFTTAEETATAISSLNGREIGGRKLRVEYKKMLPFQERERIEREKRERRGQLEEQRSPDVSGSVHMMTSTHAGHSLHHVPSPAFKVDMSDREALEMYSSLLLFKHDRDQAQLALGAGMLSSHQIVVLTALCAQLELRMSSGDEGVVITREDSVAVENPQAYLRGVFSHAVVTPRAPLRPTPWGSRLAPIGTSKRFDFGI